MKRMTCRQLGGACDLEFTAETFEQMAELSRRHDVEMFNQKDPAHLEAMNAMQDLMNNPQKIQAWMSGKKKEFNLLPDIS